VSPENAVAVVAIASQDRLVKHVEAALPEREWCERFP
jgi:hypothetical protein